MKKHLILSLVAGIAFTGTLAAEEAATAAAAAAPAAVAKNDAPGSLKAGNLLLDEGKFAEAAAHFEGIGEQSSVKREPYRLLGLSTALVELGKYDEAAAAAQKAVEIKDDLSGAWNNLAAAQARAGKRDEAVATYEKAIAALKEKGADTSKLEANLTELQTKIEEGKPKKVKEAEAKAKAEAEKAAAKVEEVKQAVEKK